MIKTLFILFSVCFLSSWSSTEEHKQIVLRKIAYTLMVKSGDANSRVLPIEKVSDTRYYLKFENEFSFVTDTLINTVNSVLSASDLKDLYMVNVFTCKTKEIIYAYEVTSKTESILPCLGITNLKDCYIVQIDFVPHDNTYWPYLLVIFPLLFTLWLWVDKRNKAKLDESQSMSGVAIGKLIFDSSKGVLIDGDIHTKLTYQEVRLLELLVAQQNQVVSREVLLKEIWEKEGTVVTSRSLDVLVSKLRKKLSGDSQLLISNVHAKGYKLEVF